MLLACAAKERKSYTYGNIANILGMGGAGVMAQFLGPIMHFCQQNDYPPLTVLVVNQETGLPGDGLTTLEEVNQDRERVFRFDWFAIAPPETQDFDKANNKA
jgi:alkylated DNA nucleotide flippase Atl1